MTREKWIEHIEKASGLMPPSQGGNAESWHTFVTAHRLAGCADCLARLKTAKAARSRKAREEAYKLAGLVKGRTGLGRVIWE